MGCLIFLSACTFVKVGLTNEERKEILNPPKPVTEYVDNHLDEVITFLQSHKNQFALDEKNKLSNCMLSRAKLVGVVNPENIDIIITKNIPIPDEGHPLYEFYHTVLGVESGFVGGLTFDNVIYLHPFFAESYEIYIHELVHVAQYQRFGLEDMLRKYLIDASIVNYSRIPFETEAMVRTANLTETNLKSCKTLLK
ncbi:hypothetical protein [Ostreibacterium oceani]|uniref:DUF4157 domain-containing protein n=1 Tax=Ostreibacterium oceani TaxID=2654998 RepID=A0A6N7EWZ9_9GAMM|nr:hypothetical protein [Ostreibacterium oceani]MPV86453.1 hypothetical protein [Ostreibacterium oceani]